MYGRFLQKKLKNQQKTCIFTDASIDKFAMKIYWNFNFNFYLYNTVKFWLLKTIWLLKSLVH